MKKFEEDAFVEILLRGHNPSGATTEKVEQMIGRITRACDAAMLRVDIVMALFLPDKGERKQHKQALDVYTISAVTEEELAQICRRCNGVIVLPLPKEADDLAMVVVAIQPEDVEVYANKTISAIKAWLERVQLEHAEQKTEPVLITTRRKSNTVNIRVHGHMITSKAVIKYLGLRIDAKINFNGHLVYACAAYH